SIIFEWYTGGPGASNTPGADYHGLYIVQLQVNSDGTTRCGITTTGSGFVGATSADTGFTLNTNHTMEWDWDGSNVYCFRDGVKVVGPLSTTGTLYAPASGGGGLFAMASIPDAYAQYWPDQEFNSNGD